MMVLKLFYVCIFIGLFLSSRFLEVKMDENKMFTNVSDCSFFIYRFLLILFIIITNVKNISECIYFCDCMVWWLPIAPFLFAFY
jgi:hypothetical protein